MKRILTGIKPTGTPHIGNYLGAIQPALGLAKGQSALFFIADYHALTAVKDPNKFRELSLQVTAAWLACGLNPEDVIFYRQSDIPQIFELYWILSCFAPKGLLNRAHAYKSLVDANRESGRHDDDTINMGIFNYPVLMGADILLFGADQVPVGSDQKQHVEIARDIADSVNHAYQKQLFVLPEPIIQKDQALIPGIDGRKMSKNYDNVIPLFADEKTIRKRVMQIQTDSIPMADPKDYRVCNVFHLYQHFASEEAIATRKAQYSQGGLGYGEIKKELAELILAHFSACRSTYDSYINAPQQIEAILEEGAKKARQIASGTLSELKQCMGLL